MLLFLREMAFPFLEVTIQILFIIIFIYFVSVPFILKIFNRENYKWVYCSGKYSDGSSPADEWFKQGKIVRVMLRSMFNF